MCAAASVAMPRSFLIKKQNYSHCPLKKRPVVQVYRDADRDDSAEDNSEPENLSTKPEDLSACTAHQTPPPGLILVTKAPLTPPPSATPLHHPPLQPTPQPLYTPAYQGGAFTPVGPYAKPVGGGPLEPLNLNTAEHHYWPRGPSYAQHHHGYHVAPFGAQYAYSTATPSYLTPPGHHDHHGPYAPPAARGESPARPTYVPATHPLAPLPPPRLYAPFLSSSPDLPDYYSPRASPLHHHATAPHHATAAPTLAAPPPLPAPLLQPQAPGQEGADADENARPAAEYCGLLLHPTPPSPPLSAPEDLAPPPTPPPPAADKAPGASRHQCPDCPKSYATFSGLSKHRQFHCKKSQHGRKANESHHSSGGAGAAAATFSCKHCDKTYVSLGALKMHIRTHTLPCECKLCGKAFSRPWLLQGHIRTHTGEKPFSCPHCCRAFADRSNLRAHLQTHSDVKKYSCPRCARTFSRMSLLAKHSDGGCANAADKEVH